MAILTINSTIALPNPSEFTCTISDLSSEESGRTLDGTMIKDIVSRKTQLSCRWNTLNWQDTSLILQAVESSINMQVTYPDPKLGIYTTKTFYVGDRTAPAIRLVDGQEYWQGMSFDFIEV